MMQAPIQQINIASQTRSPVCSGTLQRKCACGQHIQSCKQGARCADKDLNFKFTMDKQPKGSEELSIVREVLSMPGQPLDSATRAFMEPRFGHDFSKVRVHTDTNAADSARSLNALAYTMADDIVFDKGYYTPDTNTGKKLLAHELTHVLQQQGLHRPLQTRLSISKSGDAAEREAEDTANAVVFGVGRVPKQYTTPMNSIQRRSTEPASTPAPPATPLTVSFTPIQADSSPVGMPDRIPPRVDTIVGVGIVGFTAPMLPVSLSIDGAGGGNGTATINGAASVDLTSTTAVLLRGVKQTGLGNAGNLRLVADQGGTRLATSNNFSVSAIPQNHTITFNCLVPAPGCASILPGDRRGFKVRHDWESDSTEPGDLDQTDISERVEVDSSSGSLAGIGVTTSGYLGVGTRALIDEHAIPARSGSGTLVLKQTQMFKDLRTGAVDIPVTNSGYKIGHIILPKPGTGVWGFFPDYEVTTMKFGFGTNALGVRSDAGSGSVTRVQDI